jgi:type II secretory pathway pseudopilin PulG
MHWLHPRELLITISIILALCAIAIPHLTDALENARIARATTDIHTIGNEARIYQIINGFAPDSLHLMGYGDLTDPWRNPNT